MREKRGESSILYGSIVKAKLIVVGNKGHDRENTVPSPFVGPSGKMLLLFLLSATGRRPILRWFNSRSFWKMHFKETELAIVNLCASGLKRNLKMQYISGMLKPGKTILLLGKDVVDEFEKLRMPILKKRSRNTVDLSPFKWKRLKDECKHGEPISIEGATVLYWYHPSPRSAKEYFWGWSESGEGLSRQFLKLTQAIDKALQ